jgi:putative nucleotidyltransferase with HDIG domain
MKELPITRTQAIELLKKMNQSETDMNHYIATEKIMRKLAEKFNEDKEYWGMVGLLHDIDWAITKDNVKEHCIKAEQMLRELNFNQEFIENVQSHCYNNEIVPQFINKKRKGKIQHALTAAETITGIITAYKLMRGTMEDMQVKGLKKKFKDKKFAANCNRELVKEIELTGITLDEFFEISIQAMQNL